MISRRCCRPPGRTASWPWVECAASSGSPDGASLPGYRQSRTVDELTEQNVQAIHRLERAASAHRSSFDHLAEQIDKVMTPIRVDG